MGQEIAIIVHPIMLKYTQVVVTMLADGLSCLGQRTDMIVGETAGYQGRAIVVGAHLFHTINALPGLTPDSIILNLENTASGAFHPTYLEFLQRYIVWDYSARNALDLGAQLSKPVYVLPLFYVPRLTRILPAEEQDIDVLFYGMMNARRQAVLAELTARGLAVCAAVDVFGDELDRLIARAKIVLNVHFYEPGRLEYVRMSDLFANRCAVASELNPGEDCDPDLIGAFVAAPYAQLAEEAAMLVQDSERRQALAQVGFEAFARRDSVAVLGAALAWSAGTMLPRHAVIGSGKSFDEAKFNIDTEARLHPDIVADISADDLFTRTFESPRFGRLALPAGHFESLLASHVLEHIPDLVAAMTNCLKLLADGGEMHIMVPYDLSYGAWQDPTHVRAFNERSWLYYCEWCWYVGWLENRFDLVEQRFQYSSFGYEQAEQGVPAEALLRMPRAVDEMHVVLRKRPMSEGERNQARELRGDLRAQM